MTAREMIRQNTQIGEQFTSIELTARLYPHMKQGTVEFNRTRCKISETLKDESKKWGNFEIVKTLEGRGRINVWQRVKE